MMSAMMIDHSRGCRIVKGQDGIYMKQAWSLTHNDWQTVGEATQREMMNSHLAARAWSEQELTQLILSILSGSAS